MLAALASAQLPQVRLDSVFPPGARVGTTVEVAVGGVDFDEVAKLHFDHPGLSAVSVGPNKFKVTVAGDVAPGVYDLRVSGKHGVSNPRAFAVSGAGEEIVQKTPNHVPEQAQAVPFGCVVNGQFRGALDDFYRVPLKPGQRAIVEVLAERIDSPLDATLSVLAPDGREVGANADHFGRDPLVDFTADQEGDYLVRVWDFLYRGGSAYRLRIGNFPVVDGVLPLTLGPGETRAVTLLGRNLPGGKLMALPDADGKRRETLTVQWTAPTEPHWLVPPRSFPLDDRYFQRQVLAPAGESNPITARLFPGEVIARKPDNDAAERAQELPFGGQVQGVLDRYNAAHWYAVALKAKQNCYVEAASARLGAPGDLFIQVLDPKGKLVTELDEWGSNYGGGCRCYQRDPWGSFTAESEGVYRLVVRNRARDGSPVHRYLLSVGPPRPDFAVYAVWNLAESLRAPRTLLAGGRQALDLVIVKRDHFGSAVECAVEGLPPSIQCPPVRILGNQDRGTLVVTADAGAPAWEGPIRVRCRAKIGETMVERVAWGSVMLNDVTDVQVQLPSRLARQVWLGVRPGPAPFTLSATAPAEIVRGTKLPIQFTLQRSPGFSGKVTITAPLLPNGWKLANAEIAAGAERATAELEIPANAGADVYDLVLRGEGPVKGRDGKESAVGLPANPIRVTIREK
jgi:hypothetical protein